MIGIATPATRSPSTRSVRPNRATVGFYPADWVRPRSACGRLILDDCHWDHDSRAPTAKWGGPLAQDDVLALQGIGQACRHPVVTFESTAAAQLSGPHQW